MNHTDAKQPQPRRRKKSPVFVDRWEVKDDLGVADNQTVARMVERGQIPGPIRWLTPRRPVWLRTEWKAFLGKGRGEKG